MTSKKSCKSSRYGEFVYLLFVLNVHFTLACVWMCVNQVLPSWVWWSIGWSSTAWPVWMISKPEISDQPLLQSCELVQRKFGILLKYLYLLKQIVVECDRTFVQEGQLHNDFEKNKTKQTDKLALHSNIYEPISLKSGIPIVINFNIWCHFEWLWLSLKVTVAGSSQNVCS